jgi:peptidoglycan-associated lipoprotein
MVAGCKKRPAGPEAEAGLSDESLGGSSLEQAKAGTLGRGPRTVGPLEDIHFAFDSFDLDEAARQSLQRSAEWLKAHGSARVELEGHCDDRGTVEYNLALGAKRAAAAKQYVTSLGIDAERITTISYGEELPLCHDQTEECWQQNRRAHFAVVGD